MKITKEIEEYINLTITEHMGKSYTVWKLKQQTEVEPDEVEKAYKKVMEVCHRIRKKQLRNTVMLYSAVERIRRNSFIDWD